MKCWFTFAALLAVWAPTLGCCYGPGVCDPCGGWGGNPCGQGACGSYAACGSYSGCGSCGSGSVVCGLLGQAIGCIGSGISCVGHELSSLGHMAGAGCGTCAPYGADPCHSSCVPQTFDTYAPLGCAAPPPVSGCAAPFPSMPSPEGIPTYDGMPTYMVPGSTPMPIHPQIQQPTFAPGPTPLPGATSAPGPTPLPSDAPVPAPQGAMYYDSTALPHAMHVQARPEVQTAEAPRGPQIQMPPELEPPRPLLTVPAETPTSPPAPPAQDIPLPTIQPGSHYVPTGATTTSGPIRQAAAETRWTRGF